MFPVLLVAVAIQAIQESADGRDIAVIREKAEHRDTQACRALVGIAVAMEFRVIQGCQDSAATQV